MSPPLLESLPLDVAYNILSQLYQNSTPKDDQPSPSQPHRSPPLKEHPYLILPAVSKTLNELVEAYCAHLLAARRARFPGGKYPPAFRGTNRQNLLQQMRTYCEFCNKKSSRRAVLASELICCKKCDQDEWPTKITMTEACKKYHLQKRNLFDAKIRYGTYFGVTGLTTLFLEHEVREVATRIHAGPGGDLAIYLALRTSQSVERKAKQEEAREAKKAHLRRVLLANGLPDLALVTKLSPFLSPAHNQRPAISVLEAVRMQILEQRLETELGYRQTEHGPDATSSYIAWDNARAWDTRVISDTSRPYSFAFRGQDQAGQSDKKIHDSRDMALFELFCKEFGLFPSHHQEIARTEDEESESEARLRDNLELYKAHKRMRSSVPTSRSALKEFGLFPSHHQEIARTEDEDEDEEARLRDNLELYKAHKRMWSSVPTSRSALMMPKQAIIASGRRSRWESTVMQARPPWSWARYPILVKDVVAEDLEQSPSTEGTGESQPDPTKAAEGEKEWKRIIKWNTGAVKEMGRITALIKERGLDIEQWCKLKKPQYKVEEVEAADALQVLREGDKSRVGFII